MTTLPQFMMTSEKGSFARKTIEELKPGIIDNLLSEYDYTPEIKNALLEFKSELSRGTIKSLCEKTSDVEIWEEDLSPFKEKGWLEIPWLLAETYFFRRILEIIHYFQPGPWQGRDPYQHLKNREISQALPEFVQMYQPEHLGSDYNSFHKTCQWALWGNQSDLSNLEDYSAEEIAIDEKVFLDQSQAAFEYLSLKPNNIAYIMDNVGKELYCDLAFIDFLLTYNFAASITLYMKNQPFFVSDALPKDLKHTIGFLESSSEIKCKHLAEQIIEGIKSGRIKIEIPPFMTTSRMYRKLPDALKKQLYNHDLTILKGDVNFRRLVGERHWEPTTTLEEAAGYFPTATLSLRTQKSELVIGITQEKFNDLEAHAEKDWQINGKRGMIAFLEK